MTLNKKESSLPIFLNTKINFMDKHFTPYFNLKAGYSVMDAKGLYTNPGVGVSFFNKKNSLAISIELGYSYQKAKYRSWSEDVKRNIKINDNYHGLNIKFSYEINFITIK